MKNVNVKLTSIAPMLMHSDRTANPLDQFARELKKISGKRKKTEDDYEEMSKLEFIAGCYYDKKYFIPAANIEACLIASAKHTKRGTIIKQAIIVPDDASFNFKHEKHDPTKLFEKEKLYVDMRTVKVGTSKVIRTRPIFNEWEVSFQIYIDTDKLNVEELREILENAGKYVGLGDYRPRYGRFQIASFTIN
jgi:hypothetical protein